MCNYLKNKGLSVDLLEKVKKCKLDGQGILKFRYDARQSAISKEEAELVVGAVKNFKGDLVLTLFSGRPCSDLVFAPTASSPFPDVEAEDIFEFPTAGPPVRATRSKQAQTAKTPETAPAAPTVTTKTPETPKTAPPAVASTETAPMSLSKVCTFPPLL